MAILLGILPSSACPFAKGEAGMPSRPPAAEAVAAGLPSTPPAAAAGLPPISPAVPDRDVVELARPAAAAEHVEVLALPAAADEDVEAVAQPVAKSEADLGWLQRIKIESPSFPFRRVFSGVARAGDLLGGAYRRSFVARHVLKFTAICTAAYRRSMVPVYIDEFSSLCARSWRSMGVVFNPLPAGSQLLPISDPSERLCFVVDMERLQLLALSMFALGAVLFISLERFLVVYEKLCGFYSNIEWLRLDTARDQQQLPPSDGEQQQLPPPVGEQQQLLPPAAEPKQLLPSAAEQQQLPAHATEHQLLSLPLPSEMDIC